MACARGRVHGITPDVWWAIPTLLHRWDAGTGAFPDAALIGPRTHGLC